MILGMGIHASHTETLQTLREKFIWCGMKDNCEDFVINCCNQPKPATLKRNASFKKFDLQQRVSLFQKIRTMVCFWDSIPVFALIFFTYLSESQN